MNIIIAFIDMKKQHHHFKHTHFQYTKAFFRKCKVALPGVDFIKVGRKAQIIEIALSICALRLRPTF